MNKQDIFDRVWEWFITKENPPGFDPVEEDCVYLTDDNRRCAVGVLLPRSPEVDAWAHEFVGGVESLLDVKGMYGEGSFLHPPKAVKDWIAENQQHEYFLSELQETHDTAAQSVDLGGRGFIERFRVRMEELAEKFNLEVPA